MTASRRERYEAKYGRRVVGRDTHGTRRVTRTVTRSARAVRVTSAVWRLWASLSSAFLRFRPLLHAILELDLTALAELETT